MNAAWRRVAAIVGGAMVFGVLAAGAAVALRGAPARAGQVVVVHRAPECTCCEQWAAHLREAGFAVEMHEEPAMDALKTRLGVPPALGSCHTATVGRYVIEGHVPAADIRRLLEEQPAAAGLAVPGMPVGSPGMEQGGRSDAYAVLLWRADAPPAVYARHGASP